MDDATQCNDSARVKQTTRLWTYRFVMGQTVHAGKSAEHGRRYLPMKQRWQFVSWEAVAANLNSVRVVWYRFSRLERVA